MLIYKAGEVGDSEIGDVKTLPGNRIGELIAVIEDHKREDKKLEIKSGDIPFLEIESLIKNNNWPDLLKLGYFIRRTETKAESEENYFVTELWLIKKCILVEISRGLITKEGKIRLQKVIEGKGSGAEVSFKLPGIDLSGDYSSNNIGEVLTVEVVIDNEWDVIKELKLAVYTPKNFQLYRRIFSYKDGITQLWSILIPTPPVLSDKPTAGLTIDASLENLKALKELGLISKQTWEKALLTLGSVENPVMDVMMAAKDMFLKETGEDWTYHEDGKSAIENFRNELNLA